MNSVYVPFISCVMNLVLRKLVVTALMTYLYYKKSLLRIFIEFQTNKLNVFCRGLAFYIAKGSPLTVIADHRDLALRRKGNLIVFGEIYPITDRVDWSDGWQLQRD
ncbi:hypothetical protein ACI2OX_07340 [Bacillus sp. N9]